MRNKINDLNRCLIPNENSVDIKSFKILFFRSNHILLGIVILVAFLYSYFSDNEFKNYINNSIFYEETINKAYNLYKEVLIKNGESYEDYYQQELPGFYDDFLILLLIAGFILLPWLLYLFWPQRCPIRVDKKRELIYTWSWGKLYAARFDNLNPKKKDTAHFLEMKGGWGPLIISLYPAGSKKAKRVSIGSYIPKFNYQNHQLLNFIRNYLNGFTTIPNNFKPESGFLEKTLIKDRSFPEEEKLKKALDEWLAKESS
ncbi:hypothetical protein [Kangiella shandongensis]|uniref:hypothetical protein n=1 Tax=Kangiella shandongensis TaxID=2763258 RepID=UPI001CBDE5EA|nr:hypothetical protein [Kangiella shandongensis]